MESLERIGSFIRGFAGYGDAGRRRVSEEQVRAFVGEMLAELPALDIDNMSPDERSCYDRVLLRCEFVNQDAFRIFDSHPTPQRIDATLSADVDIVEAAGALAGVQTRCTTRLEQRTSGSNKAPHTDAVARCRRAEVSRRARSSGCFRRRSALAARAPTRQALPRAAQARQLSERRSADFSWTALRRRFDRNFPMAHDD